MLADELIESDLPDDPYLREDLLAYFPKQMLPELETAIEEHPLRREIIVTQVVNDLVNGAGMTFWTRLAGETGASAADLTRANFVAREIFGSLPLRQEIARWTTRCRPSARPGCGSRCARSSSVPRAGWSPTVARAWTPARRSTSSASACRP